MRLDFRRPDRGRVVRRPILRASQFGKLYQDPVSTFAPGIPLEVELRDVAGRHSVAWTEVIHVLDRLRVGERLLQRGARSVSGGELQRVAIVRALLPSPAFLFVDEPTSRLDPITQRETLASLRDAAVERDCAVLLVTHDPAIAAKMASRTIRLGTC